ncbi:MAG: hypothetical protein JXL80_08005 [Planctomycetes bacterium]|nr:hypothetical protein [Planctomycetota bacterium]
MSGDRRLLILAAITFVAATVCLAAAEGDDDSRWTPLDISASMDADIILTPNEQFRCWDLAEHSHSPGQPPQVFSGHNVGYFWGSVVYVLAGRTYFDWQPGRGAKQYTIPAGAGLPSDGRLGVYQLYMDELEHPQWSASTTVHPTPGRNAVMLAKTTSKGPEPLRISLANSQRRRYDSARFLMVSRIGNPQHHGVNRIRLVAEYADHSQSKLWEGTVGYPFGNSVRSGGKDRWSVPPDQREALRMTCFAEGTGNITRINQVEEEPVVLVEFAKPLPLDAAKPLDAIVVENADEKPGTRWEVYLLAVSARPAGN